MKIVKIFFGITIIVLTVFGWIAGDIGTILPYLLLTGGLILVAIGITEYQKRNADAFNLFLASAFVMFIAIYRFV